MALTGDTAALRLLVSQLATVGRVPRDARAELAKAALELVRDSFGAAQSPEGAAWARLKYRHGRPLVLTGRLLRSVRSRIIADGIAVTASAPYAGFHQHGTRRMPARPFLPQPGAVPAAWADAFERVLGAQFARHFA